MAAIRRDLNCGGANWLTDRSRVLKIILDKMYVPCMFRTIPPPERVRFMTVSLDGAGAVPAPGRKTCLPCPGPWQPGAPALRPAYGQHITRERQNALRGRGP